MANPTGATGASATQGGLDVGHTDRAPATKLEALRLHERANRRHVRHDYLGDLAPLTRNLAGVPATLVDGATAGRPRRRSNPPAVRRDPARLVRSGASEAVRRTRRSLESGRRTRLRPGTCQQLAGWLHRTARVHAHLCAIVRLYGAPEKAGGQSNQGDTYAERAARGDRTLLYEALTLSRDEIDAIRAEVDAVMDAAPPTPAAPGTADKVSEMARRAERGESLFIEGDGPRPGDGSPGG
jgi:hypothetical protein